MARKFSTARAPVLEDPDRPRTQPPRAILLAAGVAPGMVVADVGVGTGYFAREAAALVGPSGRVIGVDVNAELLAMARERALPDITNLELRLSKEDEVPLDDASVDLVFMGNMLHELEGDGTLREVARVLRPRGSVAVLEWKKQEMAEGPPLHERLTLDEMDARLARVGFRRAAHTSLPLHELIVYRALHDD